MNNTLEAWLKDNMPKAWFAGYDVADSALIALNEYRQAMDRLRAQVATLTARTQALQMHAEGMSATQIARALQRNPSTVRAGARRAAQEVAHGE